MRSVAAIAIAIVIEVSTGNAAAQQSVEYASLGGRVVDPSGAVVSGAQINARQLETNLAAHTTTDQSGRFRLPYLKGGVYEITVQQPGFADVARRLTLTAGGAVDIQIALMLSGVTANVTVSAEATVLETARTQIAGTIPQTEIRSVPLNGRNVFDLALAIPGVSPANVGTTQLFPETSAVPGGGLSIASQRNLSNNFVVDGLSANDDAAGLSGMTYSVDAVEQFQVITSGAQAELGRALGGYLNIVTKSGTNRHQGDAYVYLRDDALSAPNPITGSTLPMQQWQFGASAGGPLVRDRTFYFANVERRRLDQTGLVTIAPDAVRAINGRLVATGFRGPLVSTGLYQNPVRSMNVLSRIDHQIGGADLVAVRYSAYEVRAENARGAGGLSAPSAAAALDNTDHTLAASNTWSLAAKTVNETRAQFAYSGLEAPPSDAIGPAVSIAGVASFGRLSSSPTARLNRMLQVVDNISHQSGAHAVRAGVDVLHNADRITFPRSAGGSYTFSSLDNFLAGVYNNAGFTQTFGVTGVSQSNSNVGLYAQDEWKLGRGITLNYGLRYDLQFLETIVTDVNNVSPRAGLAWVPDASGRTVVRTNVGVFYDRVPLRAVANALLSAGNTTDLAQLHQISVSLTPGQASAPVFPAVLAAAVPSVTFANLTTIDRHLHNAASRQGSAEVERQLGDRLTLNVAYQYLRGVGLLMSINQNVPMCVASGTNNGCRPNPNYANNSQYSSVGTSTYHGLQISLLQRPTQWGEYRISYTLSKSMNNLGEFFFSSPIDPFDLSKDWGRSDDDQRHRLAIHASARTSTAPATTLWGHMTHGLQVSGVLQAYSPLPLNILSGVTTVQGTAGRPVVNGSFIPRNAGVGSDFLTLNLRASRTIRIAERFQFEAIAEAFNLTNRVNAVTRNAAFGSGTYPINPSPSFRQITAVAEPRSFQLGLRMTF